MSSNATDNVDATSTTDHGGKVGRRRYFILSLIFFITVINYADRSILSIGGSAVMQDLSLNAVMLGMVFSAFAWAYVIGQIPGGYLLDRIGAKKIYAWAIMLWSIFTLLQGTIGWLGFTGMSAAVAFFVLRFLLGIVEAPAFPTDSRIVSCWFPTRERGTASALFNSAQYLAVAIFTPIMGWIVHQMGWEYSFIIMGLFGIGMGVYWLRAYNEPHMDKRLTAQELKYMSDNGALVNMEQERKKNKVRVRFSDVVQLLAKRNMWALYIGQYCITSLTYFFITWFPIYLIKARGLSIMEAGWVAALPAICGFTGGISGGMMSDYLIRHGFHPSIARKIPFACGMLLSTSLVISNYVDTNAVIVALMALAFFGKGLSAIGWAAFSDVAPADKVGLAGSMFNGIGNIAGIVTPVVIGFVVSITGSFDLALWFVAAHGVLGFCAYALLAGRFERIQLHP